MPGVAGGVNAGERSEGGGGWARSFDDDEGLDVAGSEVIGCDESAALGGRDKSFRSDLDAWESASRSSTGRDRGE